MNFPEIQVFNIASTQVNTSVVREWLDSIGATEFELPEGATEAELLCSCAGRRCYKSFVSSLNPNVNKIRKDLFEYFDNILKLGHGSILEHASYTFAIENLTRVATGELNRHRAGCAISEGSMRYIRFNDIPFWMPLSLRENADDGPTMVTRKACTRGAIKTLLCDIERVYDRLEEIWDIKHEKSFDKKKKLTSMFRRIMPMGICTGGVWTFNLRALRHIIATRSHPAAEEEIAHIFGLIGKHMSDAEPSIFGDFTREEGFWVPEYKKV